MLRNYIEGAVVGAVVDGVRFLSGGSATNAFLNPAVLDFWPARDSPLRNSASAAYVPPRDFNETIRTAPADVGAYETERLGSNPGWPITPGFKAGGVGSAPAAPSGLVVR